MILAIAWACLLGAVIVAVPQSADAQRPAARDWDKHPAIVELQTSHDVFAIGDIHGDYDRLVDVLRAGRIIPTIPDHPKAVRWTAGRSTFVCTGDVINKGDHSLQVISLLRALGDAADRDGGRVVVTMGNHEAEFLADPTDNKASQFSSELKATGLKPKDVVAGRDLEGLGAFLRSLPFAVRVNDWFFIHAGNPASQTIPQLRAGFQRAVDWEGFQSPTLLAVNSPLEARLHPRPWWEREGDSPAQAQDRLRSAVQAMGVQHLVIGHQPGAIEFCDGTKRRRGEMFQKFDGLIFLIDVGMSRGIDVDGQGYSRGALLHIQNGPAESARAVFPDRPAHRLWPK
jgi:hypothetical protein